MLFLLSVTIMISIAIGAGLLLAALCWKLLMALAFNTWRGQNKLQAEAIILNLRQTGLYINDLPQIRMQMQVQPERGRSFIAEIQQVISVAELEIIREGSRIIVLYNPGNHKEVSLLRAA